jgi:O-antigen/teichoic acid export membrane protein
MKDLKEKTIRGGYARGGALASTFILRVVSLMLLARLLDPKDFGLIGMVTAFTGILSLFRDFGLSAAAVQRSYVSEEQTSTLFWINILVGALLMVVAMLSAPLVARFYHEPRLFWITTVVATSFLFNGLGIQHSAILQRQMRFTTLAIIDVLSLIIGTLIALLAARAGYGYWALVAMTVSVPLVSTLGFWMTSAWRPGKPHRGVGMRSMMRFGGALTLNGLIMYIASNFEKVLLGRYWGAEALGLYGRAYQLIRIPTDNLNTAVGDVAFSALARTQDDSVRLKRYFLKGYSLVLALTIPITIACALFADDIVFVLLGPKWKQAAQIFRLLAPTMLVFAICNPIGWLLTSVGMVGRGLKIAFVIAPLMIASNIIGLPYGPKGVAIAFSTVMLLWMIPIIPWGVHDTVISTWDVVRTVSRPLASVIPAAGLAFAIVLFVGATVTPLVRLVIETAVLFSTYAAILLFVAGQKSFYLDLLRAMKGSPAVEKQDAVSTL